MSSRPTYSLVPLGAIAMFAADPPSAGRAGDEKAVAELDTQYQLAAKNNDAATMARILADERSVAQPPEQPNSGVPN